MAERILLVDEDPNEVELITIALTEAGITNPIDVVQDGEGASITSSSVENLPTGWEPFLS